MECAENCDRNATKRGVCDMHYKRLRRAGALPVMRIADPVARFWAKATTSGACMIWTGQRNHDGYGLAYWEGRERLAHRVSYELTFGPVPPGLELDHTCRNRACVRPDHLDAVTHRVNVIRGCGQAAVNAAKTHCKRGHAFTPENTRIVSGSKRHCRTCARLAGIARAAAEKADRHAAVIEATCLECGRIFTYAGFRRTICSVECTTERTRRGVRRYQAAQRAARLGDSGGHDS